MSTIEAEVMPPKSMEPGPQIHSVTIRDAGGAVGRAMSAQEMGERLRFIKQVMEQNMTDGVDYGKVPGCGDKPGLFQPGAQKLCMMFNLSVSLREETTVDYHNFHRSYRVTVRVENASKHAEGVGECSTLESKYRYRSTSKLCPACQKPTVFKDKKGDGWYCWAKKGGCGAQFKTGSPDCKAIDSQDAGKVENENPPDHWNTVRKMAFKRAHVHATINFTNTSELWSQDLEDLADNGVVPPVDRPAKAAEARASKQDSGPEEDDLPFESAGPQKPAGATGPETRPPGRPEPHASPPTHKPATTPAAGVASVEQRDKLIKTIEAEGPEALQGALGYFIEVGAILPTEKMPDLPLRFVPRTAGQMRELGQRIAAFSTTGKADKCVWFTTSNGDFGGGLPPKPEQTAPKAEQRAPKPEQKPTPAQQSARKDPEWWRDVIVPVPRRGEKRDAYMKNPDTIGSLFDERHGTDDLAQEARQRLYGFLNHFEPKGWEKRDGSKMPPSQADINFREALDAFGEWFEKHHSGEKI